jgi:hypothetical protein
VQFPRFVAYLFDVLSEFLGHPFSISTKLTAKTLFANLFCEVVHSDTLNTGLAVWLVGKVGTGRDLSLLPTIRIFTF